MSYKQVFILTFLFAEVPNLLIAQKPVRVDKGDNNPNETTIVINPKSPNFVTGASNINSIYLSSDGGKTWTEDTASSSLGTYGDPVLLNDKNGRIYFAHLSRNPKKTGYNGLDKIVVQYSEDNGHTFSDGVGVGFNMDKMQDKPWMSLDEFNSSPFNGNLYISWTEFDKYGSKEPNDRSRIRFSRSTDGGRTFSQAITVSDTTGDCQDGDNTLEGATTAALPDGTICMAWSAFGTIWMDKSTDEGKAWGKDKAIASQADGWDMDIEHIYRSNGFPFLVSDNSEGPNRGRLYMLWGDKRLGDADIWVVFSDDTGDTWSSPIRVNNDAEANGKDQFLGHIAIDPSNGHIYTVFYDRRHSPNNVFMDTYLGWSEDGGQTFKNRRLTSSSFTPPGKNTFFGDYNAIAAQQNMVVPLWTEKRGYLNLFAVSLLADSLSETFTSDSATGVYLDIVSGTLFIHHSEIVKVSVSIKTWRFSKWLRRKKEIDYEIRTCEELEKIFKIKRNRKCLVKVVVISKLRNKYMSISTLTKIEK